MPAKPARLAEILRQHGVESQLELLLLNRLERAGLPHMRWHDLRSSCVTLLLEEGVDLVVIQRIVGHRDLSTTQRYVGENPQSMAAAAATLDRAIGG